MIHAYVALMKTVALLVFLMGCALAGPFYALFRLLLALGLPGIGWPIGRAACVIWQPFVMVAMWLRGWEP